MPIPASCIDILVPDQSLSREGPNPNKMSPDSTWEGWRIVVGLCSELCVVGMVVFVPGHPWCLCMAGKGNHRSTVP